MKRAILFVAAVVLAGAGFLAGRYGTHREAAPPAPQLQQGERKPLYWHDPMVPQQKFDKPGKSPFMDMQLVPVYADDKGEQGGVTVSSRAQQNLGMRTAPAEITEIRQELPAVGAVQTDERRMARAEVRVTGWVEKLRVRAVNDPVRAGQVLADIYSPDLVSAQEEYLLARRMAQANAADEPLARAGRRRLESLGVSGAEIGKLETSGAASRTMPILAPISGILSELGVREGAMVQPGMAAFTLTDLSSVWIVVEVPEAQAAMLRIGLRAQTRVQTLPGRTFEGRLDYIYPELNAQARTVKARITLANPGMALRPGMFVEVVLVSAARKALTVPTEAVIQTGTRSVVIVMDGERFRAATVKTGVERDGRTEILGGLNAGERVVASGQFLIDSEASLRSALSRFEGGEIHKGKGIVTGVDVGKGRVELDHEPIPSLKWPRMTMEFVVGDKAALARLKKGDAIEFELRGEADKDGDHRIEKITPWSGK
ncbi:MAG: efflux RND transporter periplasmic adaptor subunit [Betaproteobacteria bacterium]|nr:efflux RND transporter periplasmic adaptor subunit [Betaproteobacteria bacterium]